MTDSSVATGELVRLDVLVEDEEWVNSFDRLEVFRSRSGPSGPYEELTAATWLPARFTFTSKPYLVDDAVLSLLVNEQTPIDITFSGANPLVATDIASQISDQGQGRVVAYVAAPDIVLETTSPGCSSTLRALTSTAAGIFALPLEEPDSVAFGHDIRIYLVAGTHKYSFVDPNGATTYYYKTRFQNSLTGSVGEYSPPFQGNSSASLPVSRLITGVLDLVDMDGRPLENVQILIWNKSVGTLLDGVGVVGRSSMKLTDRNGHIEVSLIRGTQVTVAIAGTAVARDITVPSDTTLDEFNLLDPSISGLDPFSVQVPVIDFATRRTP